MMSISLLHKLTLINRLLNGQGTDNVLLSSMGIYDNAKKVGFAIQLAWFAFMAVLLIVLGIGSTERVLRN